MQISLMFYYGHSMEMSIFLSLAFTEILLEKQISLYFKIKQCYFNNYTSFSH